MTRLSSLVRPGVEVYPFPSVSEFNEIMESLVQTSTPYLMPTAQPNQMLKAKARETRKSPKVRSR